MTDKIQPGRALDSLVYHVEQVNKAAADAEAAGLSVQIGINGHDMGSRISLTVTAYSLVQDPEIRAADEKRREAREALQNQFLKTEDMRA